MSINLERIILRLPCDSGRAGAASGCDLAAADDDAEGGRRTHIHGSDRVLANRYPGGIFADEGKKR